MNLNNLYLNFCANSPDFISQNGFLFCGEEGSQNNPESLNNLHGSNKDPRMEINYVLNEIKDTDKLANHLEQYKGKNLVQAKLRLSYYIPEGLEGYREISKTTL